MFRTAPARTAQALALALTMALGVAHAGARDALTNFTKGLKGLDGRSRNRSTTARATKDRRADASLCRRHASPLGVRQAVSALSSAEALGWVFVRIWKGHRASRVSKNRTAARRLTIRPSSTRIRGRRRRQQGLLQCDLTPKTQTRPASARRPGPGQEGLSRMQVTDTLGQRTEIRFSG